MPIAITGAVAAVTLLAISGGGVDIPIGCFWGIPSAHCSGAPPVSREEFGIPQGMPVILLLARMHQCKGVDTLLRAAARLNAFLLFAGEGEEMENC